MGKVIPMDKLLDHSLEIPSEIVKAWIFDPYDSISEVAGRLMNPKQSQTVTMLKLRREIRCTHVGEPWPASQKCQESCQEEVFFRVPVEFSEG